MERTKIDWCDSTFNPIVGCLHGCEYCYARNIANRFKGHADLDYYMELQEHPEIADEKLHVLDKPLARYDLEASAAPYPFGFEPTFFRYCLNDYVDKKGRNIFVCSMADLFGKWVPDSWIEEIFKACEKAPQHNYLFLTKNYRRYSEFAVPRRENMWYGVSVTRESETDSYDVFFSTAYTFASIEPILEDIKPHKHKGLFRSMDWIIIGAETGRRKSKIIPKRKWIEDIVIVCKELNIPVFMKSSLVDIWGEPLIQEFPKELRKRGQK